jgi:hypothetical protein
MHLLPLSTKKEKKKAKVPAVKINDMSLSLALARMISMRQGAGSDEQFRAGKEMFPESIPNLGG